MLIHWTRMGESIIEKEVARQSLYVHPTILPPYNPVF